MQTLKSLVSLAIICLSISSVQAQTDNDRLHSSERHSEGDLIADFVEVNNSANLEFAALYDACFARSEDVQWVAKKLNFKVKTNSIIFELSSNHPNAGTCNVLPIPTAISVQKNLSQTEKIMICTILRNKAGAVESAYSEYSKSLKELPIILETENRLQIMELFSAAKASRSKLIELCGEEAVAHFDAQHGAAQLVERCEKIAQQQATIKEIVKSFRTKNPDMSALCDAYFDRDSDIQFITKKLLTGESDQFAELNPLILAISKLPPFSEQLVAPIAPMSSNQLALTYPNLEPSYPTLEKRPPTYLLPPLARHDSASFQLSNGSQDRSDKKARLHATEAIMLLTIVRNDADKLRSLYGNYLLWSLKFASDFRHHQIQSITSLSVQESAKEFIKQRKSLVGLCGENAVTEVDVRNNFSELVKQASKFLR